MPDFPAMFWEIHSDLPREGPGDNASTARAFRMAAEFLPPDPRILDIACGPGMQTLALADLSAGAAITAVDTHQPFLDELARRARDAGFSHRIATMNASMSALAFADAAFDLIWCEGAIYLMGFRQGLTAWARFLAPGGVIAVTEPCWLQTEFPDALKAHWAEYPGMTTIAATQAVIAESGFAELGQFVLPDASWWDDYYTPMARRLAMLREKHGNDAEALAGIAEAQHEIDTHRKHGACYGYVFFVMRKAA